MQLSSQQGALLLPSAGVQQCVCVQRRQTLPVVTQVGQIANHSKSSRKQQCTPVSTGYSNIQSCASLCFLQRTSAVWPINLSCKLMLQHSNPCMQQFAWSQPTDSPLTSPCRHRLLQMWVRQVLQQLQQAWWPTQ
jgi:hypothetical protein